MCGWRQPFWFGRDHSHAAIVVLQKYTLQSALFGMNAPDRSDSIAIFSLLFSLKSRSNKPDVSVPRRQFHLTQALRFLQHFSVFLEEIC